MIIFISGSDRLIDSMNQVCVNDLVEPRICEIIELRMTFKLTMAFQYFDDDV